MAQASVPDLGSFLPASPSRVKINLLDITPAAASESVAAFLRERGEPSYRLGQIMPALWQAPVSSFQEVTTLPAALRDALDEAFELPRLTLSVHQVSTDGTQKFLFRLHDGQSIETVSIPDGDRITVCISSQVGCALQCAFCATGLMGFARNLHPSEIAGQVRELALLETPLRPTNIVFMGMGEPLMNWPAVDTALTILNHPDGCGIGARHITVSTVGVLPGIVALGQRPEQFRLAISVHAPSDALRRTLMPINVKYPLETVIRAAADFDRRVTFEYVMLGGVNDQPAHADELAALARACGAFVNLIPLHPGGAGDFTPTSAASIRAFAERLRRAGIEVATRKSRGKDIAAACGQLRVERLRRGANHPTDEDRQVDEPRAVGPGLDRRPA
ncbi:MAG: 23S rRNA (adenine(2503)-C(2))-methyltransferase RlmN [Gemmatimonadetes bacterium]|nr:23S rRNA (adenine(2503)-C(2))-methyltransferase RlmN [Gemmatimonadota bacterium]